MGQASIPSDYACWPCGQREHLPALLMAVSGPCTDLAPDPSALLYCIVAAARPTSTAAATALKFALRVSVPRIASTARKGDGKS